MGPGDVLLVNLPQADGPAKDRPGSGLFRRSAERRDVGRCDVSRLRPTGR